MDKLHDPEVTEQLLARLIANEPEPVTVEVCRGMEYIEEKIEEFSALIKVDEEWPKTHIIVLQVPGADPEYFDKLVPICCSEHLRTVAKAMLQAVALGWVDAWQEAGRHAVHTIFQDKTIGLREKLGLLNLSIEYMKAAAVETMHKEGWHELVQREMQHEGQH